MPQQDVNKTFFGQQFRKENIDPNDINSVEFRNQTPTNLTNNPKRIWINQPEEAAYFTVDGIDIIELARKGMLPFANVKDHPYNAKGNGTADDTSSLNSVFGVAETAGSVFIYIPDGVYIISNYIRVHKNTTVFMAPNAVIKRSNTTNVTKMFINGIRGDIDYATGYDGDGNIHFIGGTIDGNSGVNPFSNHVTMFDLGHGSNISLEGITLKNAQNSHYIQISGCEKVLVRRCKFYNNVYTETDSGDFEAIQIEALDFDTFPTLGEFDNTPSRDVTVEECVFDDVIRAMGTHSFIPTPTTTGTMIAGTNTITVADATAFNVGEEMFIYGAGVAGRNITPFITFKSGNILTVDEVASTTVTNTKVSNATDMLTPLVYCTNINFINNVIRNCKDQAIRIQGYSHVVARDNYIESTASDVISVNNSKFVTCTDNSFVNSGKTGLYMNRVSYSTFRSNSIYNSSTLGGYAAIRVYTTDNTIFEDNIVTSDVVNYTYATYFSDGNAKNRITNHRYTPGTAGLINASDTTEFASYTLGGGQEVLFSGDLNTNGSIGALSASIRAYSFIVVEGNDNSSVNATMVSMVIPRIALAIGSSVGRYRLVLDDSAVADRVNFSFPTATTIQIDDVSGTNRIRRVTGLI